MNELIASEDTIDEQLVSDKRDSSRPSPKASKRHGDDEILSNRQSEPDQSRVILWQVVDHFKLQTSMW